MVIAGMKKKKLVYLISHGHTARGAFQTGLLSLLVKKGYGVIVLVKQDPEGELKKQVEAQGATIDYYTPPSNHKLGQIKVFRAYVNQNIRRNPTLWEKHQRRTIDSNASWKRRFINTLYLYAGNAVRYTPLLKKIYVNWESRQYEDDRAVALLQKYKPDAVISTRPIDDMETFLLNAARRLVITRIMYILSWDNITAKGIFRELADHYLTWGPIMNEELKEYYNVQDKQIHLTGVTHFDVHREVQQSPNVGYWIEELGLQQGKPYLFFTMSASYYAPNEIDIIEWLAQKVETDQYGEEMQLILRPHMHNFQEGFSDLSWKNRLLKLQSNRVAIDFPDIDNSLLTWYSKKQDMLRLSNLLYGASICFNSGSTVAIESCIMDRPTIITLFDTEPQSEWKSVKRLKDYLHLKKLFDTGGVAVVESLSELDKYIMAYLKDPALNEENRQKAVKLECYKNDGKATERFVNHIKKIIN